MGFVAVISNAAFVPPVEFGFDDEEDSENSLVVGFLSNLTREKGLYLFLGLLRAAELVVNLYVEFLLVLSRSKRIVWRLYALKTSWGAA
jgi:hypothetical protein